MKKNVNGIDIDLTEKEIEELVTINESSINEYSKPRAPDQSEKTDACFAWVKSMYDAKVCKCEELEKVIKKDDEYKAHNG